MKEEMEKLVFASFLWIFRLLLEQAFLTSFFFLSPPTSFFRSDKNYILGFMTNRTAKRENRRISGHSQH